ncbi:hypothetical protein ACFQ3Z_08685 [Streptomyces nogalater]
MGTPLFDRSGRRVALTEAGMALLPHAERIIDITETARREVAAASPRVPGARLAVRRDGALSGPRGRVRAPVVTGRA